MNLLEHYIKRVISVEECNEKWTKEDWAQNKKWVRVKAEIDCYGPRTIDQIFLEKDWNDTLERGYYMA